MTIQDFEENVKKYQQQKKEIEMMLRKEKDAQILYSSDQIKQLAELGYLEPSLYEWYLKTLKKEVKEQGNDKTQAPSEGESQKVYENAVKRGQLFLSILHNKELLQPGALDDFPTKFFKSLEGGEFGISRIVSDPLNHVPQMLQKETQPKLVSEDIYHLEWESQNSTWASISLEYRFRADSQEAAEKQAQAFVKRLTGRQKKVFEACWAMANKKLSQTFTCQLVDLMELAYPSRKGKTPFSVKERKDFYQDLLDLSQTNLYIKRNSNEKKSRKYKRKKEIDKYNLPLITIYKLTERTTEKNSEKYPNKVSLSVLHNPMLQEDPLFFVGAGIKFSTLELRADDIQLAEWVQIRKSQLQDKTIKYITLSRDYALQLANLDGIKHKGMANRKLMEKLQRLKEKRIIQAFPKKIVDKIRLKIR